MALQPVLMSPAYDEQVPYVIVDASEEQVQDNTVMYAASFAVCALAVAGVSMSKQNVRPNRTVRAEAPVMQLATAPMGTAQSVRPQGGMPNVDSSILVQGGSLRTWSYRSPAVEQVQVVLGTEGRPLDADIELWHGPDNTPVKMRVYCENGQLRPFSTVIETPRGPNTVAGCRFCSQNINLWICNSIW